VAIYYVINEIASLQQSPLAMTKIVLIEQFN